jgi:bifunctional pyridoxal-dependent enzyme with beta-cystathionase and maltose regulon repressor activities
VIDGPAFGDGGPGAFRLNFATPQPILTEMVERVAAALGDTAPGDTALGDTALGNHR